MLQERDSEGRKEGRGWEPWNLVIFLAIYVTFRSFLVGTLLFVTKQCKPVSALFALV